MSNSLIDDIQLRVTSPKTPLAGLDNALAKLNALNAALTKLQSGLAGLTTGSIFKRTAASFSGDIKTSGEQSRKQLTKLFGFDERDVKAFADRLRETQKAEFRRLFSDAGADTLRNPTVAGKFFAKYGKAAVKNSRDPVVTLQQMFSGGGAPNPPAPPKPPSGSGGAAGAGGGGGGGKNAQFSIDRQRERNALTTRLRDARAVNDPAGMAVAQEKAAANLSALAQRYKLSDLQQARLDGEVEKLRTAAARNRARAEQGRTGQQRASATLAERAAGSDAADSAADQRRRVGVQRASAAMAEKDRIAQEKSLRRQQEKQQREQEMFERNRIRIQRNSAVLAERLNQPPKLPKPPKLPQQKPGMLAGFEPAQFAANVAKVTGWAAAVGVLYKTLDLATMSLNALINTGAQMARLDQVFSKVGGSTRDLTDDVLALSAANGRSTQEAMEAAIQWSRLGLTRAQVNEAVRASLLAANVAEISAGEATEKLQAIMAAYGLQVSQVSGVLGELNAVSNVYNATVGGMLEGLSRTASVAKQAGLPLSELVGMLGAAIGTTGQTGANIGNAIKSITVALSNPVLQETLRRQFRIEVSSGGGEDIKNMSQILGELYDRYQNLNNAQRQSLLFSVAGKTQASRLAAILDSYVKGQSLAITAQLNLNSAEAENAKIKATLKSRLQGLITEWERFVAVQGSSPSGLLGNLSPADALGEMVTGVRNIVALMNFRVGADDGSIGGFLMGNQLGRFLNLLKLANEQVDKMRGGTQSATRAAAGFDERAEQFGGAASAAEIQQRQILRLRQVAGGKNFLSTLKDAGTQPFLFDNSSSSQQRAIAVMSQLRAMKEMNDVAGIQVLLQKELDMAVRRTTDNREMEREANEASLRVIDEQIQKLNTLQSGGFDETRAKEIAALEGQRNRTSGKLTAYEDGSVELFEARSQRMAVFQEKTRAQLERISQLYRDMPVTGAVQATERELEMLRAQVRLMDIKAQAVQASGASQLAIAQEMLAIDQQRMKLEAQAAGVAGGMTFARVQDRMSFGRAMGANDATRFGVGASTMEMLRNRQMGLVTEAGRIRGQDGFQNDAVQVGRLMEITNQLIQTRLQMREREAEIEREINQLVVDRNREFNKSLLASGPGDLLRKMAALKMSGNMTGGGFMALSPEMRQDVGMINPRFNPDLMDLRREQNQQIKQKPEAELKIMDDIRALTTGLLDNFMPVGEQLNEVAAGMREVADQLDVAVRNLANLEALSTLPAVVQQIMAAAGGMAGERGGGPFIPMGRNAGEVPAGMR